MKKKLKNIVDRVDEALGDTKEELIAATAYSGIIMVVTCVIMTPFMIAWKKLGLYNSK